MVATDCGGPRDIIEDGVNGFLVPVGDVDAIISRIQLLLADPALRDRMRQQALESVKRFSWEKCVSELQDALFQVAGNHAGSNSQAMFASSRLHVSTRQECTPYE